MLAKEMLERDACKKAYGDILNTSFDVYFCGLNFDLLEFFVNLFY